MQWYLFGPFSPGTEPSTGNFLTSALCGSSVALWSTCKNYGKIERSTLFTGKNSLLQQPFSRAIQQSLPEGTPLGRHHFPSTATQSQKPGEAGDDRAWIGSAMELLHADAVCCRTLEQQVCVMFAMISKIDETLQRLFKKE